MIAAARVNPPQPLALAVDIQGAAFLTSLSVSTLTQKVRAGTVPYLRDGRALRFNVAALQRWIDAKTVWPPEMVMAGSEQAHAGDFSEDDKPAAALPGTKDGGRGD